MDEARVTISSDPALSQTDILSLLTLGATQQQLTGTGQQNTTTADVLRNRLESLSSQEITGYVSGKVGHMLGLEQLSIQGNLFNLNKNSGPELIASKRLSDRLKITYTTNVGQLNNNGIRLDYKLTNHFSLEGQTDQFGNTGVDLKYKIKFK